MCLTQHRSFLYEREYIYTHTHTSISPLVDSLGWDAVVWKTRSIYSPHSTPCTDPFPTRRLLVTPSGRNGARPVVYWTSQWRAVRLHSHIEASIDRPPHFACVNPPPSRFSFFFSFLFSLAIEREGETEREREATHLERLSGLPLSLVASDVKTEKIRYFVCRCWCGMDITRAGRLCIYYYGYVCDAMALARRYPTFGAITQISSAAAPNL